MIEGPMQVLVYYTPGHAGLFERFLRPSACQRFEVVPLLGTERCGGDAAWQTAGWNETCQEKMTFLAEALAARRGEIVVCSDPDILFLDVSPEKLREELGAFDLAAQRGARENDTLCSGFMLVRASDATIAPCVPT